MRDAEDIELQPETHVLGTVEAQAARLEVFRFDHVLRVLNARRDVFPNVGDGDALDAGDIGELRQIDPKSGIRGQKIEKLIGEIAQGQAIRFGDFT